PGHQPASLQVHGDIATIMASMEVLDLMEQQFLAAAGNDLMARIASGEINTKAKLRKLLDQYGEELKSKYSE
ncbi:recombinase family protein, partial [Rhizobium skierniewicense]|nr:recombinase family protein [Rhizobium skierniewicense]